MDGQKQHAFLHTMPRTSTFMSHPLLHPVRRAMRCLDEKRGRLRIAQTGTPVFGVAPKCSTNNALRRGSSTASSHGMPFSNSEASYMRNWSEECGDVGFCLEGGGITIGATAEPSDICTTKPPPLDPTTPLRHMEMQTQRGIDE
jgi:hypothetical protein